MASQSVVNFMKQQGFTEEIPLMRGAHFAGLNFQPRNRRHARGFGDPPSIAHLILDAVHAYAVLFDCLPQAARG